MNYVDEVLQPGERVLARATIHWVTYMTGAVVLAVAVLVYIAGRVEELLAPVMDVVALAAAVLSVLLLLGAWLHRWSTEIDVTDRRVIYKTGIISRRTKEMHVDQIESVEVEQSIFGRLLGYGDIAVNGTGEGIENIRMVAEPLRIRSAITAR